MSAILDRVCYLLPGKCLKVSRHELQREVRPPHGFSEADWVLEQLPGSAYSIIANEDAKTGDVLFTRVSVGLPDDGSRTYVSPDRRDFYERDLRGIYHLKTP